MRLLAKSKKEVTKLLDKGMKADNPFIKDGYFRQASTLARESLAKWSPGTFVPRSPAFGSETN